MPLFVPKDRKSLFRQFLAGMYDAVVITDPNGHIIEINPRAGEHFGYSQDEVIDRPILSSMRLRINFFQTLVYNDTLNFPMNPECS